MNKMQRNMTKLHRLGKKTNTKRQKTSQGNQTRPGARDLGLLGMSSQLAGWLAGWVLVGWLAVWARLGWACWTGLGWACWLTGH